MNTSTRIRLQAHSFSMRLSPTHRIGSCECGKWTESVPRKNGAWMRLKKAFRLHVEGARRRELAAEEDARGWEPDEDGALGYVEDD